MAIMEEIKMPELSPETGSKPPSSTPAYFVIMHQSQGDDKKEERILVANRDVSAVAPVVQSGPHESKSVFLSADCTSGEITVTLDNNNMWNEFYRCSTEMVLTKQGRRMFPYCRYWLSGLSHYKKYILVMDITPLDTHRYKWNGKCWEPGGNSEPHVLGRVFIHPESPSTGEYWMNQPVSFYKLKLTNNVLDQEGHIILHSMHRYLPRLHVIPADKTTEVIQLNGPDVHTFTFPQTEFFAVTAYQNIQITQLKIDCNPFAKGFRDGTVIGRPAKDDTPKKMLQANDVPSCKQLVESNHPESVEKLKESFTMSEQSDADTENEYFTAEKEAQNILNSQIADPQKIPHKEKENDSFGGTSPMAFLSKIKEEPIAVQIKQEPEDDYDYDKPVSGIAVKVKQEQFNEEVTEEYSNSDNDYPILERHFARFSTRLRAQRKCSVSSPSGVAKAKLLKLEDDQMPTLYLESCFSQKTADNTNNSFEPMLNEKMAPHNASFLEKSRKGVPGNMPCIKEEPTIKLEKRRPVKNKVYAEYFTPPTFGTNRGRKRKLPSLLPKSGVAVTPGSESTVAPVAKRRGRPPKHKGAKVGRPSKKRLAIDAPQLLPDFKPDLEDVDGVLFVAFSSKEALDVHTGGKSETVVPQIPPPAIPSALPPTSPTPPVEIELTEEQRKIAELERQLLIQLRTMRHRQVIHPSLQQVGLKLNIVDHTMTIDLWYLGVELPLPFISNDSRLENSEFSSEGFSFVSRTGKTTDYTKIKGWRDKFSANSSVKTEGNNLESLKNRSAFCSDELDEYLENEAKLMEDMKGTFKTEPVSATVSCQFPTKSSSYVRTLESVLKKQSSQLSSSNSLNISKPPSLPVKKRKYTRRRGVELKDVEDETKQRECNTGTLPNASAATNVNWQFPEKNTSCVRTVDIVVKTEAPEESSSNSVNTSNAPPLPVKKRKYTRRALTPQMKMKLKAVLSSPVIQDKPAKPPSPQKQKSPKKPKLTPSLSVTSPVTPHPVEKSPVPAQHVAAQSSVVSSTKDNVCPRINQAQLQSTPLSQKTLGLSKAQVKLLELEENALWEGKPRTFVTEERAEVALSALLTAQVSLKNKPVYKMINKRTTSCKHEFCRLGCVCSSLNHAKRNPAHCQQEICMFSCQCEKGKSCNGNDVLGITSDMTAQTGGKIVNSLTSVLENKLGCAEIVDGSQEEPEHANKSQKCENALLMPEPGSQSNSEGITTINDGRSSDLWSPKVFPIWDRSDVDNDPEPMCIPKQGAVVYKTPHRRGTLERGKSSAIKYDGLHTPRTAVRPEDLDSEYWGHYDVTCARVRAYKPKAPEEKPKEGQNLYADSEAPGKEHDHKLSKRTEREKENAGDSGKEEKRHKKAENRVSTKLLKIISDCSWEQDRRKILNIVSQRIDNKEPQSFAVGRFNIELTSETKDGDASKYSAVSRMKISVAPDQKKDQPLAKSPLVRCIKPPEQQPSETCAEKETKSHGGKGLPFYAKVLPAGKLVARLKSSTLKQSELIQVNGKNYPQAKLLLGHMGALHPSNRLPAYLANKLQPSPLNPSNEANAKGGSSNATLKSSAADGNVTVATAVVSPQNKTVTQSVPKSVLTHSVMEDIENQQQNNPENKSLELSAAGLPKLQTQSPLVLVSNSVLSSNQAQVASSSTSVSMVTKLVTSSSVAVPTKTVPATSSVNTTKMATLTFSPTKESVPTPPIPPPALIRAPCPAVNSSVNPPSNTGTNKTLAASVASSLVASANLPTIGMVGSPPRTPTVTVRTVTSPSGLTPRPVLTPETNKRLGPRLLLIPVPTSSASLRPIQCVQTSPGQRMVLQPIKSPNGINLFRHPNGQLIQLVPLHQVQGKNLPPSQHVVIRNPGPAINIQLPLQTKHDVATPTSAAATSASPVLSALAPQIVSPSKISPNKSGVTIVPSSPSRISQTGIKAETVGSPSSIKNEVSPSVPKVFDYTNSGHAILASAAMSLNSGGLPLLKIPLNTSLNSSCQDDVAIANVIAVTEKPAVVLDANTSPCHDVTAVPVSEEKVNRGKFKQSELLEIDKTVNLDEVQSMPKESATSTDQEGISQLPENVSGSENSAMLSNNKLMVTAHQKESESEKANVSVDAISKEVNNNGTSSSSKKGSPSSANEGAENLLQSVIRKGNQNTDCSTVKSTNSSSDYGGRSPVESHSECRTNEMQASAGSDMEQQTLSKYKEAEGGQEDEGLHPLIDLTPKKEKDEHIMADLKSSSNIKESEHSSQTEDESEVDDSVDIETVEELSEKINIARLKAIVTPDSSNKECTAEKGFKKDSKVSGDEDLDSYRRNRHTHTAKERKRRNEMRDLFEELKNALGLHNLPKVSKSYILKKAIEEIEGLTDEADSLIKQKTLMSQIQSQLIKKVSNLSGKTKEVVLKKLEYLYAKQRALEAVVKKKDFEKELDVKETMNKSAPFTPLRLEHEAVESSSIATKVPIILSRKPAVILKGPQHQQSTVIMAPNVLLASKDHAVSLKEPGTEEQAAGNMPVLVQTDLKPPQIQTELASMVIQLPGAIQHKGIIDNSPVSISLPTMPSTETPSFTEPEKDDLSMMPKIVNVTSLADEASSGSGIYTPVTKECTHTEAHSCLPKETTVSVLVSGQADGESPTASSVQSTCLKPADEKLHKLINEIVSPDFGTLEDLTLADISDANAVPSSNSGKVAMNDLSFKNISEDVADCGLEMDLNKLSSAMDDAQLEPSELLDVTGDQDSDETLKSLLNELELFNQQLNIDHTDMGSDFPESDAASQGSIGKSADGDSSPFFFGRFKELSESKENLLLLSSSPLFLQPREGEIQEIIKNTEEPSILVFEDGATKEPLTNLMEQQFELQKPPVTLAPLLAVEKPVVPSTSDAFWRPMPKLAPLGLKSPTVPGDQRVLLNKSMPSLASAAVRLNSPKPME